MNWMTSGRHRALRSKRGKKRSEMHFPAHVQRELARVRRHPLATAPAPHATGSDGDGEAKPAWYIRPIMAANESHDIQMLELAREVATGASDGELMVMAAPGTPPNTTSAAKMSETKIASKEEKKVQERRCVFTPVKANRPKARGASQHTVKKITSPPPRGLLLFNDGEQLSKVLSSASKPEQQYAESAAYSARWSSDPRKSPDQEKHGRCDSHHEAPFYAASSSSSDEGTRTEDLTDDSRVLPTPRLNYSNSTHHMESIEPPIRGGGLVPHKSMLEEIDHALHSMTSSMKQDKPERPSRPRDFFGDGRLFAPPLQNQSEPLVSRLFTPNVATSQGASTRFVSHLNQDHQRHRQCQMIEENIDTASTMPNVSSHHKIESEGQETGARRELLGKRNVREETEESDSSQGSFILPPPVDWQKMIVIRYNETAQSAAVKGDALQDQFLRSISGETRSLRYGTPISRPDHPTTSIQGGKSLTTTWRSTSRTRSILTKVEGGLSCPTRERTADEKILQLQRKLREKDAVVLYMHTMLQCHRIDQGYASLESHKTRAKIDTRL